MRMQYTLQLFLFIAIGAGLCACASESSAAADQSPTGPVGGSLTVANVLTSQDSLPYPVYSTFDEVAPLFQQESDTVFVINFWATWCKPCVEELPYFERLAEEMADQPVKIVMVSLDFKSQVATKLKTFVEERPFTLPVVALTDTKYDNWIDQVDSDWSGAIPVTLIYRKRARLFFPNQFANYGELAEGVRQFL